MSKVKFYGLNMKFSGYAAAHLKSYVKKIVHSLDGRVLDLKDAVKKIEKIGKDTLSNKLNYEINVSEEYNHIGFYLKTENRLSYFRLIKYEEIDPAEKERKIERIRKKRIIEEKKIRTKNEKEVRKKLNNYSKPKNIDDLPVFTGWTPKYTLEYFGFKLENRIELLDIGKEVERNYKRKGQFLVSEGALKRVTEKEMKYGRRHAGSKELFEQKRRKIQKTFNDLNEKNIDFVVYRTFRGWPAVWDAIEFFSKPKK